MKGHCNHWYDNKRKFRSFLGDFHPDHKNSYKFEVEDVIIMNPMPPALFIKNMLVHDENYTKLTYYEGCIGR